MAFTLAQLQLIKAEIVVDPALNGQPNTADGAFEIAQMLNTIAVPDFTVWRTNVPTADCKKAMSWTEFIGRSAGERDAWQFMIANGTLNAGDTNVRQGVQDIFSGPQGLVSRTNLLNIAKRLARRIERVLATGVGSSASPATMGFEGTISFGDVLAARAL